MNKYIDAEKLITILEERRAQKDQLYERYGDPVDSARADELTEVIDIIDNLQKERPEVNIWHDVKKEAPTKFGAKILVLCKNKNKEDGIWLADLIQCFEGQYKPRENWEDPVKWAYLSEILPQRD